LAVGLSGIELPHAASARASAVDHPNEIPLTTPYRLGYARAMVLVPPCS
jgi:hypothetical protein